MYIRPGVDISMLNPEIRRTLKPVSVILNKERVLFAVSSTYEGNHPPHLKHYGHDAYDVSLSNIVGHLPQSCIKQKLGPDFDVVFESNLIHIEYDPK